MDDIKLVQEFYDACLQCYDLDKLSDYSLLDKVEVLSEEIVKRVGADGEQKHPNLSPYFKAVTDNSLTTLIYNTIGDIVAGHEIARAVIDNVQDVPSTSI